MHGEQNGSGEVFELQLDIVGIGMRDIFHGIGLFGSELLISALGTLLLLVLYRGLRDERFLRSWMIFEFFQTVCLSGTIFQLFYEPTGTGLHGIPAAIVMSTSLLGGLGPLFLFRGFKVAIGGTLFSKYRFYVVLLFLGVGLFLGETALRSEHFQPPVFEDLTMAIVTFCIAVSGLRVKATRFLATSCGLKFLSLAPKLLMLARFTLHNNTPLHEPSPQATVYLSVLLLQSVTSGFIILGMVKVVAHKHQQMLQNLDQTMEQLRTVNLELDRLAGIDSLTNVANRRSLERRLAIEWRRATRGMHDTISLLAIDVDHFKMLNDTYGHPAGDACLKMLASVLKEIFQREEDLVARIGGDEFVVITTGIDGHALWSLAERVRVQMELSINHCTLSIGCATMRPTIELRPEMLLRAADEALYHAKENGRNQVFYQPLSKSLFAI